MRSRVLRVIQQVLVATLLAILVQGCVLIRITEHRLKLNGDGSGEALLRLIDLRSDAPTDSLITRDFTQMMQAFDKYGTEEFEKGGRKIVNKQFIVRGDTLILEVSYTFTQLEAVEGLRSTKGGLYMVVGEGRELVRTNGRAETWKQDAQRITWDADARRLMYVIREKNLPPSTSLARWYIKFRH